MDEITGYLRAAVFIGVGATALLDLWAMALKLLFNVVPPDFRLVGRWLAWMVRGRFRHDRIGASPSVKGELVVGWVFHYLVGITFAAVLLVIRGSGWIHHPTLLPALLVGIGSVAAPFFLMQPGMGAGIAAGRTPRPGASRLRSLTTHAMFGLALYAAGWFMSVFPMLR